MKGFAERYLNEIVSLTVMALMAVALIAGQADAMVQNSIRSDSGFATATPDAREASELAAAALYLLSDGASYITGVDLVVDGGLLLH